MSHFEDLSGEIMMAIFEYMDIEDVWTIFFDMNSRFNSLVFDSRLRLRADASKLGASDFDTFCSSLTNARFNNIFTLILSNNYYRYPQIRMFLSHTTFHIFDSLHALTLLDINYNELMEVTGQIRNLSRLNYFHVNTHEIFREKELNSITRALLEQPKIRVSILSLHEQIQWSVDEATPWSEAEVLSLDYIKTDNLLRLLLQCPRLRSLTVTVDTRDIIIPDGAPVTPLISLSSNFVFAQISNLRLRIRPFDVLVLDRLLSSVPGVRRLSIETIVYDSNHIRAPFWTLLFQQRLPLLERIRLVLHAWYLSKTNSSTIDKVDVQSLIGGYRYDRYWHDRAYNRMFFCRLDSCLVLKIR